MKVKVDRLIFKTIIGILPFEREKKQKVIVDLSFTYHYNNKKFIDYSQIASLVKKDLQNKKYGLIEDAIYSLKNLLVSKYDIKKIKIKISKPDILDNCVVSVSKKFKLK